ncbi:DinB family protein [Paenisporosarcina sp. TG-14]|uniref:DinB family protein n=1 Tax=Paenisporosarcina sp. TG-14 TaxID=1231057 RepID=UPI0002D8E2C3|nr:DinB family protein [Paenisporosarcina sp. TG-14]
MEWQSMFRYHKWATQKLLDHVESQDASVFHQEAKNSFKSISETYSHILSVDYIWYKRLTGIEKPEWIEFDVSTVSLTKKAFTKLHVEMEQYFLTLSDDDWNQVLKFTNLRGDSFSNRREEMFFTFINHASYHRGQVTSFLRQFDIAGTPIDYIYFSKESQS